MINAAIVDNQRWTTGAKYVLPALVEAAVALLWCYR